MMKDIYIDESIVLIIDAHVQGRNYNLAAHRKHWGYFFFH